jgi:cytochrome P450
MRLHAAVGLPLWRVVPDGGTEIAGKYFPAGTVIGLNPWVAHYNEDIFGPDAKEFRPERWLEAEKEGGERLKALNGYYLPFGLGSRTCLGRHISELEMSKLIPRLVRDYDFELERPHQAWNHQNYWFVKPTDFTVRVVSRKA